MKLQSCPNKDNDDIVVALIFFYLVDNSQVRCTSDTLIGFLVPSSVAIYIYLLFLKQCITHKHKDKKENDNVRISIT